jgi:hypothetical protein
MGKGDARLRLKSNLAAVDPQPDTRADRREPGGPTSPQAPIAPGFNSPAEVADLSRSTTTAVGTPRQSTAGSRPLRPRATSSARCRSWCNPAAAASRRLQGPPDTSSARSSPPFHEPRGISSTTTRSRLASASGLASRQSTSRSIVAPMATKQKRPQWGTPARGARMHATAQAGGWARSAPSSARSLSRSPTPRARIAGQSRP